MNLWGSSCTNQVQTTIPTYGCTVKGTFMLRMREKQNTAKTLCCSCSFMFAWFSDWGQNQNETICRHTFKKKKKRMNLSRFGSGLICSIRPSATACQQLNSNSGRAAGVPLIIYLPLDGGNWSSVATTKRWLIKGCLFRNQNLLLDRLLHLVPIISSRSPSHMLNSARMWELHHIRMHVFCNVLYICVCVCSTCSATSCCVWKTSVILHL